MKILPAFTCNLSPTCTDQLSSVRDPLAKMLPQALIIMTG